LESHVTYGASCGLLIVSTCARHAHVRVASYHVRTYAYTRLCLFRDLHFPVHPCATRATFFLSFPPFRPIYHVSIFILSHVNLLSSQDKISILNTRQQRISCGPYCMYYVCTTLYKSGTKGIYIHHTYTYLSTIECASECVCIGGENTLGSTGVHNFGSILLQETVCVYSPRTDGPLHASTD
jgi:hypothetical protein